MVDYLNKKIGEHQCGDEPPSSSFSLEFSSDSMEGGGFKFRNLLRRSPSPPPSQSQSDVKKSQHTVSVHTEVKDIPLNFIAISDPEGCDILKQAQFFPDKDTNIQLYICGDIFDSTGDIGVKLYDPFVNKPQNSNRYGEIDEKQSIINENRLYTKSHNLHNIKTCLKYPNIHLIFGNRDLNKLKCKYLCVLNGDSPLIKNFNEGNIDLTQKTYDSLCKEITEKTKPWKIHRMKNWSPFWNSTIFNENAYANNNFFKERFDEIFGQDPFLGTMSAQNLLYTIPYEIFKDLPHSNLTNDYRAFIVLAIFRSMCLIGYDNKSLNIENPHNSSNFKGWLNKLYYKGSVLKVIHDNNNLYIMSHGGITKQVLIDKDKFKKLSDSLENNDNDTDITQLINIITQKGGYHANTKESYTSKELIEICDDIIKIYTDTISSVLNTDEMNIPNAKMIFLLMTTAPYTCDKIKKIKDVNCDNIQKKILSSDLYGPVFPGVNQMRNLMFTCLDKKLFQLIGHIPMGFGTIVDKFKNDKQESYLITLDNSNSFIGTSINTVGITGSASFSMFKVTNNIPSIRTNIVLDVDGNKAGNLTIEKYNDIHKYNSYLDKLDNKVYHSDKLDGVIQIDNPISDISTIIEKTYGIISSTNNSESKNNIISYHGYTKTKYHILTHQIIGSFNKNLLILNDHDFAIFLGNLHGESHAGGYREKYLKYKQKYIQLKQLLESQ